jgi:hypothetical protein
MASVSYQPSLPLHIQQYEEIHSEVRQHCFTHNDRMKMMIVPATASTISHLDNSVAVKNV